MNSCICQIDGRLAVCRMPVLTLIEPAFHYGPLSGLPILPQFSKQPHASEYGFLETRLDYGGATWELHKFSSFHFPEGLQSQQSCWQLGMRLFVFWDRRNLLINGRKENLPSKKKVFVLDCKLGAPTTLDCRSVQGCQGRNSVKTFRERNCLEEGSSAHYSYEK